jgi:hypothetical protein
LLPDHAPDAVQAVALVEDQLSAELPPDATVLGLALNEMVGACAETDTVADCVTLPPGPAHVSVNSEVASIGAMDNDPLAARWPNQPPEAVHPVTFCPLQLSTEEPPAAMVLGFAWMLIPPAPVHASWYSVVLVSLPVDHWPLVGMGPCQPLLATQAVALAAAQVSVATPWSPTVVGLALSVMEGAAECTVTEADCAADPPWPEQVSV